MITHNPHEPSKDSSTAVLRDKPNAQHHEIYDGSSAPRYSIAERHLGAVEIPAIVENPDRAVKAFGRAPNLQSVLDPARSSIPLYLNPESPFCKPLLSHNARSHNVVLKVSVPKRTGRKRKRGSEGPWLLDGQTSESPRGSESQVCSTARLDNPSLLREKLEDTIGKYKVEAIGTIQHTHRFRGFSDFYWDASRSEFAQRYTQQALQGDVEKLKEFTFRPGSDQGPHIDILPPPQFTHMPLPFNYQYSQNPYVRNTEDGDTINVTAVKAVGYFLGADDPAPPGPQHQPNMDDPTVAKVFSEMEKAFLERPLWTRRSLLNRLANVLTSWNELKKHLSYVAYQFKGGPWRDAVIPYGTDPRTDAKYRHYQTLMFKIQRPTRARRGWPRNSARRGQGDALTKPSADLDEEEEEDEEEDGEEGQGQSSRSRNSHLFDGNSYSGNGKMWQVCDITDPLLRDLLDKAEPRDTWDAVSGWYHGGLWAKVRGIMKTKLVAIQFGRKLEDAAFAATLRASDASPVRNALNAHGFRLPLPNLKLTREELERMGKTFTEGKRNRYSSGYVTKIRDMRRGREGTTTSTAPAGGVGAGAGVGADTGAGAGADELATTAVVAGAAEIEPAGDDGTADEENGLEELDSGNNEETSSDSDDEAEEEDEEEEEEEEEGEISAEEGDDEVEVDEDDD